MKLRPQIIILFLTICLAPLLSGCAVFTVADTAVSVAGTAVKTTAKVAGAVVEAGVDAVSDDDEDKKKKDKD